MSELISQHQQHERPSGVVAAGSFQFHIESLRTIVESALREQIANVSWPASLKAAVEYSLMAGGKRLRPVLVLLASEVCGGTHADALPAACAIEMIHTYSLIHDDLPSMDNDDYRRGRLTSHKVFGEALAILAGDCLLTQAFETITAGSFEASPASASRLAELTKVLAKAAGGAGMVGGQVLDLEAERGSFLSQAQDLNQNSSSQLGCDLNSLTVNSASETGTPEAGFAAFSEIFKDGSSDPSNSIQNDSNRSGQSRVVELSQIHKMKTGALIVAALELGAISAGAGQSHQDRLRTYGHCIGLAFQIADDLLDVTGDKHKLGKTPGRDIDLGKLTYPSLLGIEESQRKAQQLVNEACQAIDVFGDGSRRLKELARFIVERDH